MKLTSAPVHRALHRVVDVRPDEVRAMIFSFLYFFFALGSWFVLRPIRDEVGAASGARKLPWLFLATLTVTFIFNPPFAALVARYPARRFIPYTYHFIAANLAVFYVAWQFLAGAQGSPVEIWTGRVFFVWTTVFTLFITSVFWCFMADVFTSEQAKRLFGFIGLGGTLGSIAGSATTAALAKTMGTANLILVSIVLLELAVLCVVRFPVTVDVGRSERSARDDRVIGGSAWAGITSLLSSPYLLGIAVFLMLFSIGSTYLYTAQSVLVGDAYADKDVRTAILARLELVVQVTTVVVQAFFTGRIIRWVGLSAALAFLPLVSILGFGAMAAVPTFAALAIYTVVRRAGNFALNNPAMETLFTVVPREDKYKAKSFIETVIYRFGDQVGVWTYGGLDALGWTLSRIALAFVPLAMLWLPLGVWLGRKQGWLAAQSSARPVDAPRL